MERLRGTIGLAMRAGQLALGEEGAVKAIRAGGAALALLDADASENTRKRLTDACAYRKVPLAILPGGLLEDAAGRGGRMSAVMAPGGLAKRANELLSQSMDSDFSYIV